VESEDPSEVP